MGFGALVIMKMKKAQRIIRRGFGQRSTFVNQQLATLANSEPDMIKAELRHNQFDLVTASATRSTEPATDGV
jgi:hypothetical protein